MTWPLLALVLAAVIAGTGAYVLMWAPASPTSKRIAAEVERLSRAQPDAEAGPTGARRLAGLRRTRPYAAISRLRLQAVWSVGRTDLLLCLFVMLLTVSVIDALLGVVAGASAIPLCAAGPAFYLIRRANHNRRRFIHSLPGLLDRMRQLLISGNSLIGAFDRALENSDEVVRAYLEPAGIRLAHGVNLPDALLIQAHRLGINEIAELALVARANLRFGGNLADVFERMSRLLRDRVRAQKEYEALTAEVRTSSKILFLLPIAVIGGIFALKPEYLTYFVENPTGQALGAYAVASALVGAFVLKSLQNIRF